LEDEIRRAAQFGAALKDVHPQIRRLLRNTPAWSTYQSGLCVCHRLVLVDVLANIVSPDEAQQAARDYPAGIGWPVTDDSNENHEEMLPLIPSGHPFIRDWDYDAAERPGTRLVKKQSDAEAQVVDLMLEVELGALESALLETEREMNEADLRDGKPIVRATQNYLKLSPVFSLERCERGVKMSAWIPASEPSLLAPAPLRHNIAFKTRFEAALIAMNTVVEVPLLSHQRLFEHASDSVRRSEVVAIRRHMFRSDFQWNGHAPW
jgi:hypothetical protein